MAAPLPASARTALAAAEAERLKRHQEFIRWLVAKGRMSEFGPDTTQAQGRAKLSETQDERPVPPSPALPPPAVQAPGPLLARIAPLADGC